MGTARAGGAHVHHYEPLENPAPGKSTLQSWDGIVLFIQPLVLLGLGYSHPAALPDYPEVIPSSRELRSPDLGVLSVTLLLQRHKLVSCGLSGVNKVLVCAFSSFLFWFFFVCQVEEMLLQGQTWVTLWGKSPGIQCFGCVRGASCWLSLPGHVKMAANQREWV